jgi:hypothetical protein
MHTPNQNLLVGAVDPGAEALFWAGDMHNVRLFNTALSASDVALLYDRPWVGTDYDETFPYSPPVPSGMSLSTDTAATSLNSGCVAWYPLTEGTGNSAADISGSSNNATGTAVSWENSTAGNAYEGSGGYVQSTSFPVTNVSAFSVSAWIKNNGVNADYLGTWSGFSGSTEKSVLWRSNNLEAFVRNVANTAEASFGSSSNINSKALDSHNGMAHCVFVVDSGTATWYINGVQTAQNLSFMAGPYIPTSNTDGLLIGEGNGTAMTTGSVQNVRMWDRALTADEVTLLYERPWDGESTYGDLAPYDPPATLALKAGEAINTGCVGWWPLLEEDDYASGAADISGNANNGTQSGGVLSAVSPLGGVASFDGVDDYIAEDVSTPGAVNSAKYAMTFSCWMYHDDSTATQYGAVAADTGTSTTYVGTRRSPSGNTGFIARFGGSQVLIETATSTLTWYHVVGVIESSTSVKLYLDGVLIGTDTTDITGSGTCDVFTIGGLRWGSTPAYLDGNVQNVRIWDRALSAAEVQSLYETPWIGSNYPTVAEIFNYIYRSKRFRRL